VNTGAVSNEIVYGAETRGLATDCNGDIYSLHVTFGYSGMAASNILRKTYANFTPAGSVGSGFLLSEAQPAATCYGLNPAYSPASTYQVLNAIVVNGPYVFIYDGATIRRINKTSLSVINSVSVPNGVVTMCGGIVADLCGNIYAGTTNGIAKFDSSLTYVSSIPSPAAVYDLILGYNGELLACGDGFLGSFATNCIAPPLLIATATLTNNSCEGATASIIATGGVAPYSYLWQPGGQTTANLTSLTAGTYTYTVTDPFCHSYAGTIIINPNPISNFKNTSVCNGSPTVFTDSSKTAGGVINTWSWSFGDGNPANNTQNPSYTYINAGNYSATLIVNNNFGCSDTIIKPVQVYYNPVASFTHQDVCLRDSMYFTNTSTVDPSTSIASYLWVFGDGSPTSNLKNPAHYYSTKGTYTVTLVTTTIDGCSNAAIVTVNNFDTPTSVFTYSNTCLANSAVFTNASTPPTMGTLANWSWNFGDGSPLNTTVSSPQHLYNAPGNYQVTLITHSSNLGCPDTLQDSITVYPMPFANFNFTNVCLHDAMNFNDSSIVASGSIASWSWNFGDGSTLATIQNPSHTYTSPGTYSVSLIVTTNNGCKDTALKSVVVHPLPVAQFSRVNVCDGTSVQFNNLSTIAVPDIMQTWTYNYGDGNSGTIPSPSHLYAAPGSYTVKLVTVTGFGCSDSISKLSIVHPNPVTDFVTPNPIGCEPLCVNFKDTSTILTGLNAQYLWNVGDGSAAHTTPTFTHCYTNDSVFAANTFNVTLTVTSDSGCVTTKVKNNFITVYPNPKASFSVEPESTTITDPVITFKDLSTGATIWGWNFGDNTTSTIEHPTPHTYQDTGTYVITLITSTQYSCIDTTHQTVTIEPDFMFYIPSAFTPDGDGINDYFTGKGVFIKEFEMSIFDRWGNLIFFSDDINKPWDGKANHGTEPAQRDVYVYSIKVTDYNKKNHSYKGTVTLVR
jgi:gliding motility-associated-like protein